MSSSARSIGYIREVAKAGRVMANVLGDLLDANALPPDRVEAVRAHLKRFREADAAVPLAQRPGLNTLDRFRMKAAELRATGLEGLDLEREIRTELLAASREVGTDGLLFPVTRAIRELPSVSVESVDALLAGRPRFWGESAIWLVCASHKGRSYDVSTRFAQWLPTGSFGNYTAPQDILDALPGRMFDEADPAMLTAVCRGLRENASTQDRSISKVFVPVLLTWRNLPFELLEQIANGYGEHGGSVAPHPKANEQIWDIVLGRPNVQPGHFFKSQRAYRHRQTAEKILLRWPSNVQLLKNCMKWAEPEVSASAFRQFATFNVDGAASALSDVPQKTLKAGYTTDDLATVVSAVTAEARTATFFASGHVGEARKAPVAKDYPGN